MTAHAMELDEQIVLDAEHPWPGLASFNERAHEWFRGRDAEKRELFRLVESSIVTVLYGVAGLGKTSLLQAGLFPELRDANWLPVPVRLDVTEGAMPLVDQVFAAFEREVPDASRRPARIDGETLWEFFHRRDASFWNDRHRIVRPVLVFDQFEELFTVGKQSTGRAAFLEQIADLGEGRPPARVIEALANNPAAADAFDPARHRYAIIFSLREDYVAELDALRPTMKSLGTTRMRLTRMDGDRALDVVEAGKHLLDDDTAHAIVRFVAKSDDDAQPLAELEVEPALLSVVCAELNRRRLLLGKNRIDRELLALNRDTILEDFYEDAIAPFPQQVRKFVEEELLTPTGARASVYSDQADEAGVDRETIRGLVDCRLVRVETRGRTDRIELTHDLLTDVIVASRNRRREIERREAEVARLAAEKREAWVRRRLKMTNIFLVIALGALATAGVLWFRYRVTKRQAAEATAWWSFTAARDQLANERDAEGLAYLANAIRNDPAHVDARRLAMHMLLTRLWYVPQKPWTFDSAVQLSGITRDGKYAFAVTGPDLHVIDTATGARRTLSHAEDVSFAEFTRDGARIITTSEQVVTVWGVADGKQLDQWREPQSIDSVAIAPAGTRVAVASGDEVHVRAAPGQELRIPTAGAWERVVRFSADGARLAIAWTVSGENRVQFNQYDAKSGAVQSQTVFATKTEPAGLAIAPALSGVAAFDANGVELHTPGESQPLPVTTSVVSAIEFAPDGQRLVGVVAGHAEVWAIDEPQTVLLPDGEEATELEAAEIGEGIQDAMFAADGSRVITTSTRGFVRVWDPFARSPLSALFADAPASSASMNASGDVLLIASGRNLQLRRTPGVMQLAIPAFGGGAMSGDESTVYVRGASGYEARDATTGMRPSDQPLAPRGSTIALPRAGSIVCIKEAGLWSALDTKTGRRVTLGQPRERAGGRDRVVLLLAAGGRRAVLVRIGGLPFEAVEYDLGTGAIIKRFAPMSGLGIVKSARISADGNRVAFRSSQALAVADVTTGAVAVQATRYQSADLDRNGARVLVTDEKAARILDARTLARIGEPFNHAGNLTDAVFAPDGKSIVTLSEDGTAQGWQIEPHRMLPYEVRYGATFATVQFSPDGGKLLIATLMPERQMSIWDTQRGTPVTLPMPYPIAPAPRFGSLGRRVVTDEHRMATIVELREPAAEEASLLADFAEYVAGLKFVDGRLVPATGEAFTPPASLPAGDVGKLIAAFFASDRTVTPFTNVKLRDYLAQFPADARKELALVYPGK